MNGSESFAAPPQFRALPEGQLRFRRLGPHRAILVDMHGVRYYIDDSRQLDAKSRRILSQYL